MGHLDEGSTWERGQNQEQKIVCIFIGLSSGFVGNKWAKYYTLSSLASACRKGVVSKYESGSSSK